MNESRGEEPRWVWYCSTVSREMIVTRGTRAITRSCTTDTQCPGGAG